MPLRLTLKPGERAILGSAVIRNGDHRSEFLIENGVPVLRETDILSPTAAHTVCQQVYLALQLIYLDHDSAPRYRESLDILLKELAEAVPSLREITDEIAAMTDSGRFYQALKRARTLIKREEEMLRHVS
jgi:flagellar protein FlbT